jgi:hypothetical protein
MVDDLRPRAGAGGGKPECGLSRTALGTHEHGGRVRAAEAGPVTGTTVRAVQAGPVTGLVAHVLLLGAIAGAVGLSHEGWAVGVACGVIANAALALGISRFRHSRLGPADWVTLTRATLAVGVAALIAD